MMEQTSQVAKTHVQSESLLAWCPGVGLEDCQLPAPTLPIASPCFPRLSILLPGTLGKALAPTVGDSARSLPLIPLDASKVSVGASASSSPDPQMHPAHLWHLNPQHRQGTLGQFPNHAPPPCCGLSSKNAFRTSKKKQSPLQTLKSLKKEFQLLPPTVGTGQKDLGTGAESRRETNAKRKATKQGS